MGPRTNHEDANEIFARWRAEDEALGTQVDAIRQWMRELDQLGKQHFGETATRLRLLRESLVEHFERESQMASTLCQVYSETSPELTAIQNRSNRDRANLLKRIDELIERLDQLEPPFQNWQQAIDEIEAFVSLLEQHEAHEWDCIEILLPT